MKLLVLKTPKHPNSTENMPARYLKLNSVYKSYRTNHGGIIKIIGKAIVFINS